MKQNYLSLGKNTSTFKLSNIIRLLLTAFFLVSSSIYLNAQSGIDESYVILNTNGGGNIYYDLQASTGNQDFQGANLGTLNSGNTLILNGAQNKVSKCPGDNITQCFLFYRIYKIGEVAPSYSSTGILFNSNVSGAICSGGQNQIWQSIGANINVLNGLCPGNYNLEVFTNADFSFNYGSNFSTHYANNGGANYKATFTVVDNQAPTFTLSPASLTIACSASSLPADTNGTATATDNCAIPIIGFSDVVVAGIGNNKTITRTWTATDANSNTSSYLQTITVIDTEAPILTCIATAITNANKDGAGNCTTIVSLGSPSASDNCTAVGSLIITAKVAGVPINPATYLFGIGNTAVVWTATDQNGNVSLPCNQIVTVIDNENPTISCPSNISVAANMGCTATAVVLGTPVASDNCSAATIIKNVSEPFVLGVTNITWTATDASGNRATCTQTVTVFDPTSASVSYRGSPFCASIASGSPTINVLAGEPFSGTGFSSTAGLIINSSTGVITPSASAAGTYVVSYTFTGANGCGSTTSTSVTINPLPTAIAGTSRTINRGDSTTLGAVAIPGNAYSWVSIPAGFTSSISNPSAAPLVTTAYTITETTPQGCVRSNSLVVAVQDNLVVSKSLISASPSKPGDNITYQISYTNLNNNGIAAQNVTITDFLPPAALFTYTSSSPTGTYNAGSNTLIYSIASLAPGSGTITISGKVGTLGGFGYDAASFYISSGSSTQTINNSASIVNAVTPTIVSNVVTNSVSQNCGVIMPATLSGQIHTSTNSNVFYFIEVQNNGNITDRFILANNNPVQTGQILGSVITNMAGDAITQTPWLTPGQTYGFLVQVTTPGGTTPGGTNHTFIKATSIVCNTTAITDISTYVYNGAQANGCDLLISKTVSSGSVVAGTNITYTITVRNLSTNKARDVVIDDYLPTSVNYVSSSQTGGAIITWNSSARLLRATRSGNYDFSDPDIVITVTVQTTRSTAPSVINTAKVDNSNADNNLPNNNSNIAINVLPNVSHPVPTSIIICSGNSAAIVMSSPGTDRNYKLYSAATGGTLLQTNGNTYNTGVLTSSTTYYVSQYNTLSRAYKSNRTVVLVTVVSAPVINSQPVDHNNCSSPANFTYNVTGTFLSQQWQESRDSGVSWTNLVNGGVYSGVTSQALSISNVTGLNGYKYKCIVNSECCFVLTSTVVSIVGLPVITTQPITQLDCEGASVNFTAVAIGTGLTYSWQYKKIGDSSYTTIISNSSNVDNFNENKITVRNVGSAQFPNGTQFQVIIFNTITGCSVASSTATLLVNEIKGISPSATNLTRCHGTNYSYIVSTSTPPPGSVVSYQWKSSVASGPWNDVVNDVTHFSGAKTPTLNIINGTPAQSAEYKVQVIFTSSGTNCTVTTALTRRITFLPEATAPAVVSITHPDCITPTGSVVLNGLPAGNWTINPGGITGNTTSVTVSGLIANTYNFTVTVGGTCISPTSANVVIIAATTATWNGAAWTNGPPTINQALVFTGDYHSPGDLKACSCTVNAGVDVVFKPLHTLTITNSVTILGTGAGAGILTFESDLLSNPSNSASLVQINNAPNLNSGKINYERYTNTAIRNTDYTYWSSPVAGFTLGGVSQNRTLWDKYYSFNSSIAPDGDWKQEWATSPMDIGVGYIIRGPEPTGVTVPFTRYLTTFKGVPNNGRYAITGVIADKSYLLGNPYPSALDADKFLDDNQNVLDGTLYFWTHNTGLDLAGDISNPGAGWAFTYSLDDYASYNRTGGVGTAAAVIPGANKSKPTGKIAAGQGFFGSSKATFTGINEIVFNNNMRLAGISDNNSQFFKTKNPNGKTTDTIERHRVWLDLMNNQGAFKQTLIGYVTDATNDYEDRFDGESYDAHPYVDFYSVNQDKNLVIQGRALPFDVNDAVPLGFRTTINGAFTIKIDQTDGILTNQPVYIEDKLTNTVFDLKSGNYSFNTAPGTFNNRFVLRYVDKTLKTENFDSLKKTVLVSIKNKQITINSFAETIEKVTIFDELGRQIYQKTRINDNEFLITDFVASHQTLLVKIALQNGNAVTKKIIY